MNDLDEYYRRVSALDPSVPCAATRRAVLAYAASLVEVPRARRRQRTLWGSLAAAALAGALVIPHLWTPQPPERPAAAARSAAPAPEAAPASAFDLAPTHEATASKPEGRTRSKLSTAANGSSRDFRAAAANDAAAKNYAQAGEADSVAGTGAALGDAAERGDLATLRALLAQRVDVDSLDSSGRSALLRASRRGHAGAVTLLLGHGADPTLADRDGVTPLQAAESAGHTAVVQALRRAGARVGG